MDAVKFLKEKNRMTMTCDCGCANCAFSMTNNGQNTGCTEFMNNYSEKAIEIVEKWSAENPVRSYYDVMMEIFPKIDFNEITCIYEFLETEIDTDCKGYDCEECWKAQEYTKPTTTK